MLLEIVQYGNPVLRQKCRPITEDELTIPAKRECLDRLIHNMLETMVAAEGVGLAAPQVGIPIQLAVIDVSHASDSVTFVRKDGVDVSIESIMPLIFINPELELIEPKETEVEGCLSIKGLNAPVTRPAVVRVKMGMLDGSKCTLECDGLLARALQHEIDHLNGVLFIDRLSSAQKLSVRRKLKNLQSKY